MTDRDVAIRQFGPGEARQVIPRRDAGAHKWGVGGLLVIAGGPGYVGAAILCTMAAGRAGAGIVNLAVHRSLISAIAPAVPEIGFMILPDSDLGSTTGRVLETIAKKAAKCAAFVVGPGLGDDEYARDLMAVLLGIHGRKQTSSLGFGVTHAQSNGSQTAQTLLDYDRPILVDADGLNALAKIEEWWIRVPEQRLILTPHVGEMSRLMDLPVDEILARPDEIAVEAAIRFKQTILLKGNPVVVTDGRAIFRASDAPASLATAGSGDVLAGTIGALLAQGLPLILPSWSLPFVFGLQKNDDKAKHVAKKR